MFEIVCTHSHDFILVRFCEISVKLQTACTLLLNMNTGHKFRCYKHNKTKTNCCKALGMHPEIHCSLFSRLLKNDSND